MFYQTLNVNAISAASQVRTRNGMDDKSIAELAASIQEVGMLQPIIVRIDPNAADRFVIVAGHRRYAAQVMNKATAISVVVAENEGGKFAAIAQLTENIQRENLTLADTADGVAALLAEYGNPKTVCKKIGKSPAWVSKHVSLTKPGFNQDVRGILETGACDDLETLLDLDKISRHKNGEATFKKLITKAANKNLTRSEARKALADLKKPADEKDKGAEKESDKKTEAQEDGAENKGEAGEGTEFCVRFDPEHEIFLRATATEMGLSAIAYIQFLVKSAATAEQRELAL